MLMAITENRYLTLLLLFMAASISYAVGFLAGAVFFVAIGIVFEIVFWINFLFILRRR
jgi:hypothetical protein